jgi:hypothetical protein
MRSVATLATSLEALMASKDKGGRSVKKVAAKNLKEKRLDKKNKRDEAAALRLTCRRRRFRRSIRGSSIGRATDC